MHKYIECGLEPPHYGPRQPRTRRLEPFEPYLRQRIAAYPGLTGSRSLRELRERGYGDGYIAVTDFLREVRPAPVPPFEVRFETPPGEQSRVDFAQFEVVFTDEPGAVRKGWLFSMVLGYSRLIWARFVAHQDLQTVLRCHMAAFDAPGGVPREILYDRMKTAVTGEDGDAHIVYNRALIEFAEHYGFCPKACRPYRAKTKGKVERPFRCIREDFYLTRSSCNLDDLNAQLGHWLGTIANPRRAQVRTAGLPRRQAVDDQDARQLRLPRGRPADLGAIRACVEGTRLPGVGKSHLAVAIGFEAGCARNCR